MTPRFGRRSFALLFVLAAGNLSAQMRGTVGIAIGETPPEAPVQDLEGKTVMLGDWFGKEATLVEFWAIWCENCQALQPQMDAAFDKYQDRVQFVAVAVAVAQTRRAVNRHLERHSPGYDFVWDARGAAVRAFFAPTTSYIAILDANGVVAYTGVGKEQNIEEAILSVLEP